MTTDKTEPAGSWVFDAAVADAFDDMLQRSIPQYEVMRAAVISVGERFVQRDSYIVDLGCSRGESLAPFVKRFGAYNMFLGIEVSQPMIAIARDRFKGMIAAGCVEVRDLDLRREYPRVPTSLTLAILTLQFVPIEYRQRVVREAYKATVPGGALVLVEKILGATAEVDNIFVTHYHALKRDHGYSQESVDRKALSLEGVLVPVTAQWNAELLRQAGFTTIECFWRWMNFAGWVAIKDV